MSTDGQLQTLLHGGVHAGDVIMLVAVLSNALYGVLLKRWKTPLSTWQQLYVQACVGCAVLLPFWLLAPASPITTSNLPLIIYAGTVASIGAPFFWMRGVQAMGAARASQYINLLPVLVAVSAYGLWGERLQSFHLIGGTLALLGVWLGQRPSPEG